jgi:hypothetical protein
MRVRWPSRDSRAVAIVIAGDEVGQRAVNPENATGGAGLSRRFMAAVSPEAIGK